MKIVVLGMDPSLRNWGLAIAMLDLNTGELTDVQLSLISPKENTTKQVRQNSKDLATAEQLMHGIIPWVEKADAIFVECPVGSQSARAMASYGVCVGILGAVRAVGIPLIEVTAAEVKKTFTGDKEATKQQMIDTAVALYPNANFQKHAGKLTAKNEHLADAIASIHAGARTPVFQNLMRLFNNAGMRAKQ